MPYLYQWIYLRKTLPQATEYGQSLAFHSCEFTDSGIKVYDTKTTQYFDWDQILSARFFEKRVILVPTNKVPIVIPKETIGADFRVICDVLRKQVFLKHNGWTPFVS